ncbi:MAG TPA: zinc ribbon domain-containing protein [Thermoplasmata archaeon]|nr:zinc ribbon domain-containing protein [Thermoplasmata archaeon]
MSAREDVVAQYISRSYVTANSGFLKQAVIGPDEAAVFIKDGAIVEVLTAEKAKGLSGGIVNRLASFFGGGEDLAILFIVTSPIDLVMPLGGGAIRQGQVVDDAVITKDGHRVHGATTLRVSLDPNNAPKVIALMTSMHGRGAALTGQNQKMLGGQQAGTNVAELTRAELLEKFRDELIARVYLPQAKQFTVEQVRGNPDFTRDTDAMAVSEMRKTFDMFGVTILQVFTRWDPSEFEKMQMELAQRELENRRREFENAQQMGDQDRAFKLRQGWEQLNQQLTVVQQNNQIVLEKSKLDWDQEVERRKVGQTLTLQKQQELQRLELEKAEDVQDDEQMSRMIAQKAKMKDQKVDEFQKTQLESQKVGAQVEIEKARMQAEAAKYNIDSYERGMDRAFGHSERAAGLNSQMMNAAKANVPQTVVTGSNSAFTTVPAAGGAAVVGSVGPKCPSCGGGVQAGWKACPSCGGALTPSKCPHCGGETQSGWKACPNCGKALGGG